MMTPNQSQDCLSARVELLERANDALARTVRRLKAGAAASIAAFGLLLLAGAVAIPQSLEARNFILRDDSGKMRAALATHADGTPGLAFFEKDGKVRLSLDLGADGPAVSLMNGIGKPQAALAMRRDGTPGLGLFDPQGHARVSLDIHSGGLPGINLYDEKGLIRAALAIRPDGSPGLGLFTADGDFGNSFEIPANAISVRRPEAEKMQ
jgi:hypothetical protein